MLSAPNSCDVGVRASRTHFDPRCNLKSFCTRESDHPCPSVCLINCTIVTNRRTIQIGKYLEESYEHIEKPNDVAGWRCTVTEPDLVCLRDPTPSGPGSTRCYCCTSRNSRSHHGSCADCSAHRGPGRH